MPLFFICDVSKCSEEVDFDTTLLYVKPAELPKDEKHILCSQLIGIAQFTHTTFGKPSVLRFNNSSFTYLLDGNYIMVLGSSKTSSHLLKKQLSLMHSIFRFYFKNFLHVLKICNNDWTAYLIKMELIWSSLTSVVKKIIFQRMPAYCIEKVLNISEKFHQLISLLRNHVDIFGGAILTENGVLFSDLPITITTSLLSLTMRENWLENDVKTSHTLRDVLLKYVYLNKEERDIFLDDDRNSKETMTEPCDSNSTHHLQLHEFPSHITRPVNLPCQFHLSYRGKFANSGKDEISKHRSHSDSEFSCLCCNKFLECSQVQDSLCHSEAGILFKCKMFNQRDVPQPSLEVPSCSYSATSDKVVENENLESKNGTKEAILYLHKYNDISLCLILDCSDVENTFNFIWESSMSTLSNFVLNFNEEVENSSNPKKSADLFCLYDSKTTMFHGTKMLDKNLQRIHKDFTVDESFKSIYIGEYKKSIYACNMEKYQMFYEKHLPSTPKPSWLAQLYKRAHHKAEKYFNTSET